MEVRLIDESTLQRELFCQIQQNAIESGSAHYDGYKNWCLSGLEVEKAISDIFSETGFFCPTIDPETLPIVQELRKELERVTAERDNLNEEMKKYTQYINTQNPRIGRYEKLYNKIAAGCKLCRGLSSSSGVSPMCENGDPCPLNLDGDHP